jgi:putative membrane protein
MAKRTKMTICVLTSAMVLVGCDTGTTMSERASAGREAVEECPTGSHAKIRTVFRYLHDANEAAMRMGNLAAERSPSNDIREFAQRMVSEHASADKELVELARRERIELAGGTPADPVHAALREFATERERRLQNVATNVFDAAYLGPQADQHLIALKVIEEATKVATGDVKWTLDKVHDAASQHREHALVLMQDLHFKARAIGGGPVSSGESSRSASEIGARDRDQSGVRAAPRGARDGGVWPPVTAPPDRIQVR